MSSGYQETRDCAGRYAGILPLLQRYTRPFTVLDFGANDGYFSHRIAWEFPEAVVVMLEASPLCHREPGTIFLQHQATVETLEELGRCEHFDVVLALSVLHHFPDGGSALQAVLRLGDHTIVETPPPTDTLSWNAKHLSTPTVWQALPPTAVELCRTGSNTTPSTYRPVLHCETPKTQLEKHYFGSPKGTRATMGDVRVESTFAVKRFHHDRAHKPEKHEHRDWIPGINLQTFLTLGGIWPRPQDIAEWVLAAPMPAENHGDLQPYNWILGRDRVTSIDARDYQVRADPDARAWTVQLLRERAVTP